MTALATARSEWIKLSTVASPRWSALVAAVLGVGVAALQGWTSYGAAGIAPSDAVMGVAVFSVPVLMILSAMVVTGEYRSGMIATTFAATPNRTLLLTVKAAVAALGAGAFAAALALAAVVAARTAGDPLMSSQLTLTSGAVWRVVVVVAVYASLAAVLAVAVGALVRHTAGAVAFLLLWPLVVEPVLGNMPRIAPAVGPYLPFVNAFVFTDVTWLYPTYAMPWGPFGSFVYFAIVVVATFAAATVVVNRRDA